MESRGPHVDQEDREEQTERDESIALDQGKLYRVRWNSHAPSYVRTLEEAEQKRDPIIEEYERPITPEEFAWPDPLQIDQVWIEKYERLSWQRVEGSAQPMQRGARTLSG